MTQIKKKKKESKFCKLIILLLNYFKNLKSGQIGNYAFWDQTAVFKRLSEIASRPNLSKEERVQFEAEWRMYNDYFNSIESAEKKVRMGQEEARAEGLSEGLAEERTEAKLEDARKMRSKGYPIADITEITGLPTEEINNL